MIAFSASRRAPLRALAGAVLFASGAALCGCANMSDGMTSAFADPAKYELYNCKQLETERKNLTTKMAELQGLMSKAQTGVGGPVVAQVAYSNDYVALRGQARNADAAWVANKCHETPPTKTAAESSPAATPAVASSRKPARSGNAVY